MARRPWSREEQIKALALYCEIPFGKIRHGHPAIIHLAQELGRTPSAVALKLANFASLDPELSHRGVGGMAHRSRADSEIWAEYYGRWEILAQHALIIEPPASVETEASHLSFPMNAPVGPTEVLRESVQRRGQAFFRSAVLAGHDGKCCITGIASEPLLRASHIVPWSHDPSLRLDPRNGLCLNALHDAAFDRGLITLSERYELQVSRRLKSEVPEKVYKEMFESREGSPITMPERFKPAPEMLEFHRRNVFVA